RPGWRGKRSKRIRDGLTFENSESLNAVGFTRGAWFLWNDSNAEVDMLCKGCYEMHADFEPIEEDNDDE
ncbi:hypothetical protein CCACVL1_30490, partial [Corchorus capsularis]